MGLLDSLRSLFGGTKAAPAPKPAAAPSRGAAGAATPTASAAAGAADATAGVGVAQAAETAQAAAAAGDPIYAAALELVGPGGSGLPALLDKLRAGGLLEVTDVWVATGDNMPVSAGGLTKALGADQIAKIAGSLGLPEDKVAEGLATALPEIIDKLTPEGFVPDAAGLKRNFDAQLKG